jgi:hypothetical protein
MPSTRLCFSVACALLFACGSEPRTPQPPDAFAVFPNLPLPPEAQFVSRAGGEDALQITLLSPTGVDRVTEYYRDMLSRGSWRLVSDLKKPDGSVVLYAEQDGPPIWVRIWPTSDSAGTMVELAGAVVAKKAGSIKPDQPASKATPQRKPVE